MRYACLGTDHEYFSTVSVNATGQLVVRTTRMPHLLQVPLCPPKAMLLEDERGMDLLIVFSICHILSSIVVYGTNHSLLFTTYCNYSGSNPPPPPPFIIHTLDTDPHNRQVVRYFAPIPCYSRVRVLFDQLASSRVPRYEWHMTSATDDRN